MLHWITRVTYHSTDSEFLSHSQPQPKSNLIHPRNLSRIWLPFSQSLHIYIASIMQRIIPRTFTNYSFDDARSMHVPCENAASIHHWTEASKHKHRSFIKRFYTAYKIPIICNFSRASSTMCIYYDFFPSSRSSTGIFIIFSCSDVWLEINK